MILNDFGILLTSAINNTNPNIKKEIILKCEKHKKTTLENQEIENKKKEYYLNKYENVREQNRVLYDEYIANRQILYNKWNETKSLADLHNLITYKFQEIPVIDDIYTIHIKKSKLK